MLALSQNSCDSGADIPKCADARTHLLNRITLELIAIHSLRLGQRWRLSHVHGGGGCVRDKERRVNTAAGWRWRCNATLLELALILNRLVLCDGGHCESFCDAAASTAYHLGVVALVVESRQDQRGKKKFGRGRTRCALEIKNHGLLQSCQITTQGSHAY